ncbi:MAG TPA: hypothetical protein DCQ79_11450, partial [Rhizobiales bacterium]|nr:hypothetical protein [Hyphomicrobiales bacterium]
RLEHFAARRERVVHEDVMLVREEELYLAKIAIGSRLLGEFVIADITRSQSILVGFTGSPW